MKHRFRHEVIFLSIKLLKLLVLSQPLKLSLCLGKLLGNLAYLVLKKQRQITIANLKFAFKDEKGDEEIRAIAKGVFQNMGKNLVELLSFSKINRSNIDQLVSVDGLEKIEQILEKGRGGVIISAHLGNWELMAAYCGLKGYSTYVVARHLRFDKYDQMLFSLRKDKFVTTIDRSEGPRPILKALKKNGLVGILPDQDVDSVRGIFVNFFGELAYTPTGPVSLARAAKAPVLLCLMVRENGKHRLIVDDSIALTITDNKDEDLKTNTQRWSKTLESYIRKYPEQWVWLHPRWKTRPD